MHRPSSTTGNDGHAYRRLCHFTRPFRLARTWYHRVIPGYPEEAGKNAAGTQLYGPSGAPVWASPTVDAGRGLVYVGTGENYTHPTTTSSDAILAIDMETGELAWSFQGTEADAFTMACTSAQNRENCPTPVGPDLDFGMAPILVTRQDSKEILVAGQKSGVVWALDPDAGGLVFVNSGYGSFGQMAGNVLLAFGARGE